MLTDMTRIQAERIVTRSRNLVLGWFSDSGSSALEDSPQCWGTAIVVTNDTGDVLTVSRGVHNPHNVGLPGGKHEPARGESIYECAVRELREETGYIMQTPTFGDIVFARYDGYRTVTFAVSTGVTGDMRQSEEGIVAWLPAHETYAEGCTFGKYNQTVFSVLKGLLYRDDE